MIGKYSREFQHVCIEQRIWECRVIKRMTAPYIGGIYSRFRIEEIQFLHDVTDECLLTVGVLFDKAIIMEWQVWIDNDNPLEDFVARKLQRDFFKWLKRKKAMLAMFDLVEQNFAA